MAAAEKLAKEVDQAESLNKIYDQAEDA